MGYHIIIPVEKNDFIHYFVNELEEMTELDDINEHTIIYKGDEGQFPKRIIDTDGEVKKYASPHYRVGIKAEELFRKQAKSHKFTLQKIDQTLKGFDQYNGLTKNVKRADFIIDKLNVEVDVKCKTIYPNEEEGIVYIVIPRSSTC